MRILIRISYFLILVILKIFIQSYRKKLSSSVAIFSINNGIISLPIAFNSVYWGNCLVVAVLLLKDHVHASFHSLNKDSNIDLLLIARAFGRLWPVHSVK